MTLKQVVKKVSRETGFVEHSVSKIVHLAIREIAEMDDGTIRYMINRVRARKLVAQKRGIARQIKERELSKLMKDRDAMVSRIQRRKQKSKKTFGEEKIERIEKEIKKLKKEKQKRNSWKQK